jgi:opacity protein-like surface antigen
LFTARSLVLCCLSTVLFASSIAAAQKEAQPEAPLYARTNSFGIFTAYSNDSSPVLLGVSDQRKILNIGASYSRRLVLNRYLNWQYDGEVLPVAFDSDPVEDFTVTTTTNNPPSSTTVTTSGPLQDKCYPSSGTLTVSGVTMTYVGTCTRRWVYGGGISPIGFRWNFLPYQRLQPFLVGHTGFMVSTEQIPVNYAGTFNFTVDIGAGIELYQTARRSLRFEYRYHHISNAATAQQNPGIDNGLFQVSYVFGR